MKNYKLLLALGLLIGGAVISSNGWSDIFLSYEFREPRIEKIDDYYRVSMPEVSSYGVPGKPVLPIKAVCVLLPMGGEIASIDVKVYNKTEIVGSYKVEPGQLQVPISRIQEYKGTRHKVLPDSTIYSSANPFPGMVSAKGGSHRLCGYEIAHLYLYPVEYIPKTGKLSYYKRIEVNITTVKSVKLKVKSEKLFSGTEDIQNRVRSLVDNPDMIATYPSMLHSLKTDSFDYLIITDEEMAPLFEELRRFKTERGVKTEIAKVESIYAYCSGTDEQEKIRNFIIDMYMNYGIEYVLLGGDDEIIPHRGFYDIINEDYPGYEIEDYDIPSDLYYGGLDGNWNQDGDDKWGEPDEADLYAEVFVGRACVDSDFEVINFIQKTISYQTTPEINNCTTAIMAGEDLHWNVWGGEYKEEIRNGADTFGYTTEGFPSHFQVDTLYDRSFDPNRWNKDDLIPMLNSGPNLVNHLGHADILYVMKMGVSDVRTRFTNTNYFIVHTQGCYSAAFDNRDSRGSYCPEDAIAEHFTTIPNGAVCFMGNTRYGWGSGSSTNGASQRFDREFFDALFGEDIYPIGKALQDAKEDVAPYVDSSNVLRWCYYNLVLLGDPELQIWTDKPKTLTVTHSDSIIIGASSLPVNVMTDGNPVSGALVCAYQDSTIYARAYTNAFGNATFPVTPVNVGSLYIQVTAHNFLPYKGYMNVLSSSSNVVYYKLEIDDDNIGASNGNNDSKVNPGEVIELPIWVRNLGLVEAHGVYGKISSTDSHITIQNDSAYFGNILPMDTSLSSDNYVFTVATGTPDEQRITFKLDCQDSLDSLWISYPEIRIYAPVLKYDSSTVNDTGGAIPNGALDPGEEVKLIVNLKNKGSATATGVTATIHTEDTFVTVMDSTATFSDILEDSISGNFASLYVIYADSNIPIHHLINFSMYVTADGYEDTLQFVLRVGLGGDFLVWDPDINYTSGPLLADALWENGYIGDYTQDLSEYRAYLPKYKVIFTCLGIFFCNYTLDSGPNVDSLCSYLEQGGNLYIEGGNAWHGDTLTLQEYFHIDFKNEGSNEIDTVTGISGTFTDSMRFNYFGENKSIDRISGGNGAWTIFTNQPTPYTYGVAFRSGKYNTIGTSFEFGCLKDGIAPSTRAILADSIMRWFLKPIQHDVAIWSIDSIPPDIS
ncbi:hypothetical protein KAW50_03940, partial [candidate division WOR-3 bacterium]|nr:hypothetical protein [candidate division WOR-3 bacterium]